MQAMVFAVPSTNPTIVSLYSNYVKIFNGFRKAVSKSFSEISPNYRFSSLAPSKANLRQS
jgi:hypothetical protein